MDILHNNFGGDILHNNFTPCCSNLIGEGATPDVQRDPVPETKKPSNTFMIIGGLVILGFLVSQSL